MTTPAPACENNVPPSTLMRWYKFNLVGGMGIAVQFIALLLVKGQLHFNYLAATAIAVETAVIHNFVWHEQFTWADRTKLDRGCRRSPLRLLRFNLSNGAVSILGNLALMKVMVGQGHMNYLLANAIAISLCSLANFLLSETWVFAQSFPPRCDLSVRLKISSAQPSHNSFHPKAACKPPLPAPAETRDQPAESPCPVQSTKKAAATPAP
jgi:putative flippase GtrA